jgi:hypothetical protein
MMNDAESSRSADMRLFHRFGAQKYLKLPDFDIAPLFIDSAVRTP